MSVIVMRRIEFGPSQPTVQSVVLAVGLSMTILVAAVVVPTLTQPLGAAAASYVDARTDNIVFLWAYNCTLVNENLTQYYQESVDAYVDGVSILLNGSSPEVTVLFAPYTSQRTVEGQLTLDQWNDLRRNLFTYGIGVMDAAPQHPDYFPHTWPVTLLLDVYFSDNTVLSIGYTKQDQLVSIQYGTWTGLLRPDGWPEVSGFNPMSDWLAADSHLEYGILRLFEIITSSS